MARFPVGLLRLCVLACTVAVVLAACGDNPPSGPPSSPTPTPEATPKFADTIRIALAATGAQPNPPPFGPLNNASSPSGDFLKAGVVNGFIHDALYRYDEHAKPVPSLARSCDPSADGMTITCHLIEAAFQNDDPVTADDVVFTYQVMNVSWFDAGAGSDVCVAGVWVPPTLCLAGILESVSKVDDRTIAFRLRRPYAPFFTNVLPGIWIDSENVVRDAYEAFRVKAAGIDRAGLLASSAALDHEIGPAGDCAPLLEDAAQLVDRAGLLVPAREEFNNVEGGAFNACGYTGYAATLSTELAHAAAALQSTDTTTAIALVYPHLAFGRHPVGAGPYRLTDYRPGKEVTLEAWPGFHGGPPATAKVVFEIFADEDAAARAVATGDADVVELYNSTPFQLFDGVTTVRTGHPVNASYQGLRYNVRPGRLFSDLRLRQALEQCIDKPTTVDAATAGLGIVTYADVPPTTWAHDDQLPAEMHDVAAAKAKVEAAGWTLGTDGIYAKDGQRFAATIWVRSDATMRVKFAELVKSQALDCGIDIDVAKGDFAGGLYDILEWPDRAPDGKPFDLYLSGFSGGWDPSADTFDSRTITTKAKPDGDNFGGFSDPRIDHLLDQIESTYDLTTRADLFRQYQQILAQQLPELFAWNDVRGDAVAVGLRSTAGALDLDAPMWMAHPERLVLEAPAGS